MKNRFGTPIFRWNQSIKFVKFNPIIKVIIYCLKIGSGVWFCRHHRCRFHCYRSETSNLNWKFDAFSLILSLSRSLCQSSLNCVVSKKHSMWAWFEICSIKSMGGIDIDAHTHVHATIYPIRIECSQWKALNDIHLQAWTESKWSRENQIHELLWPGSNYSNQNRIRIECFFLLIRLLLKKNWFHWSAEMSLDDGRQFADGWTKNEGNVFAKQTNQKFIGHCLNGKARNFFRWFSSDSKYKHKITPLIVGPKIN